MAVVAALFEPDSADRLAQPLDRAAHLAGRRRRHRAAASAPVRGRARWWRASLRARCRSGSAPGSICRSRKPSTSEPARPNSEDENEMPMPLERRGQALAQRVEHRAGVAADLQILDHAADRADRLDQAPEGAEQAEEDQQAGHVARDVARLVEPRGDRIEDAAHGVATRSTCGRRGSPRIAAIGASSTGGRSTARPGSARRKPLTQATSGNSRITWRNASSDADDQHAR